MFYFQIPVFAEEDLEGKIFKNLFNFIKSVISLYITNFIISL